MKDPVLADREEKYLDGDCRKVVVYGKFGTLRVIYTAMTLGKTCNGRGKIYGRERIYPVKGEDLAFVTSCDELYEIRGLNNLLPYCDEVYFETEEAAEKYIDKSIEKVRAEYNARKAVRRY